MSLQFTIFLMLMAFLYTENLKDFMDFSFKIKNRNINSKMVYVLMFIFSFSAVYFEFFPMLNLLLSTTLIFIYSCCYKGSLYHKIIISFIFSAIQISIECLVPLILSVIINVTPSVFLDFEQSGIIPFVLIRMIPYISIKLISYTFNDSFDIIDLKHLHFKEILIYILLPIVTIFLNVSLITASNLIDANVIIFLSVCVAAIFIINIVFLWSYYRFHKLVSDQVDSIVLKKQFELYKQSYQDLKITVDELSLLKHDIKHQLFYVTDIKDSEISSKIDDIFKSSNAKNFKIYSNNILIDNILNYYMFRASKDDIKINYNIENLHEVEFDETLITTVLGNLLDNAFESKSTWIDIRIIKQNKNLYIEVKNSIINELNSELSTSKLDKKNHGFGIKSIKKLVESNNGLLNIDTSNDVFNIKVLLVI